MGKKNVYRVFVSSTYLDNAGRRSEVIEAIEGLGSFKTIAMERFEASPDAPERFCLEKVGEADLFVLVLAHRYGWIPDGGEKSITELEFDAAADAPRFVFVIDEKRPFSMDDFDPEPGRWEKQRLLAAFRARACDGRAMTVFTDTNVGRKVQQSLIAWKESVEAGNDAPAIPPIAIKSDSAFETYAKAAEAEHDRLSLLGFNTRVHARLPLADLYVPLRAMVHGGRSSRGSFASGDAADEMLRHDGSLELTLLEAFKSGDDRESPPGLIVLGDPGSGKTTHLKRLLLWALRHGGEGLGLPADTVPFLLPLRELKESDDSLSTFATRILKQVTDDDALAQGLWTNDGRSRLILLDGLDEVPASRRGEVTGWVRRAAAARPVDRFVVTCRYAGYKGDA